LANGANLLLKNKYTLGVVIVALLGGMGFGIGVFTFVYAKGASYLGNDPKACVNCHIMRENYNGWTRSSHHSVATCNDCHAPHTLIGKYKTKAVNGARHSWAFTTGWFHEPIEITPTDRQITENACRHCHGDIVQMIDRPHQGASPLQCIKCHPSVGHLES